MPLSTNTKLSFHNMSTEEREIKDIVHQFQQLQLQQAELIDRLRYLDIYRNGPTTAGASSRLPRWITRNGTVRQFSIRDRV